MRRVDRELGPGVWEEPSYWRSEPPRNRRLERLLFWHRMVREHDLLELFPLYTRQYTLEHDIPFDIILKCCYQERKITTLLRRESVFFKLLPRIA